MILGLSGSISAGKDMLADHLQEKFGLMHISLGDIVREIAQAQHGSIERPILNKVATELRQTYGGSVLVERAIDRYHNSIRNYPGLVITGVRSLGELNAIKEQGGKIVYVDAPIEVRHKRNQDRQRDEEAKLTLEQFKAREETELYSGISDKDFNITKIGEMADIKLNNTGTPEEFYDIAEKALELV